MIINKCLELIEGKQESPENRGFLFTSASSKGENGERLNNLVSIFVSQSLPRYYWVKLRGPTPKEVLRNLTFVNSFYNPHRDDLDVGPDRRARR